LFSIKDLVEGINIHIIDTKSTALILGYIVLEAAKMVVENKTLEEVISYSHYLSDHFKPYFMVDDLRYLIKNGRLSNAAGFIGSVLKIKPILTFNENGEIIGTDKIRTTKKAIAHIIDLTLTEAKQYKKVKYFMAYGADIDLINSFKQQVAEHIVLTDLVESILPSVIGAHVGSGVVALGYFILEK
jgi:DegV family protein with EDD domain